MVKVCPKCKANDKLSATGSIDSNIMDYECGNCGHKFQMMVIEVPVETLERIAKEVTKG